LRDTWGSGALITKVCARPPGPGASDRQVGGGITRSASVLETCPRNARTHRRESSYSTSRPMGPSRSGPLGRQDLLFQVCASSPRYGPEKTAAGPQSVLKTMVTAGSHCVMTVNVTAGQSIWSVPDPRSDVRSQSPTYRSAHRHSGLDWQGIFSAKTSDDVPPVVPENRYQSAGATESATRRTTNGNFIRLSRRRDSRRD